MIEITNLTKIYGNNNFKAVDDVTLKIDNGEIFGFLGANGAGKSTTIKCLTGILNFSEGRIKINGTDIRECPVEAKMKIGYVPDEHVIYEGLTGLQYINFIANIFGVPSDLRKERMERYINLFGMTDKIAQPIASFSHGMKQKVSVISALVHEPEVFILDEPMTGLDPQSSYQLKQIMIEYAKQGKTVFFSSHILEVVEKLCTKVAIIDKGKIVAVYDLKEMKQHENGISLEEMFLKITSPKGGDAV